MRQNGYNRGDEKAIEKKIGEILNIGLNAAPPEKP
jgi:hypothetical protein